MGAGCRRWRKDERILISSIREIMLEEEMMDTSRLAGHDPTKIQPTRHEPNRPNRGSEEGLRPKLEIRIPNPLGESRSEGRWWTTIRKMEK